MCQRGHLKERKAAMSMLVVFLLLVVNFGISWFNAWSAGRFWTESKIVGGWTRFITWCAVIMSARRFVV